MSDPDNEVHEVVEVPVERSDMSVVQIILDRNTGAFHTNNFNISKRELLDALQKLAVMVTNDLLREPSSDNTE